MDNERISARDAAKIRKALGPSSNFPDAHKRALEMHAVAVAVVTLRRYGLIGDLGVKSNQRSRAKTRKDERTKSAAAKSTITCRSPKRS